MAHNYGSTMPQFGLAVILENAFALASGVTSNAIRIKPTSGTITFFNQIIIRKNVIAADPVSSLPTTGLTGINVFNVNNAIVENNLISDCENGAAGPLEIRYNTLLKAFNN